MHQIPGRSALAGHRAARAGRRRTRAVGTVIILSALAILVGWPTRTGLLAATATGLVGLALLGRARHMDVDRWVRGAAGEVATAMVLESLPGRRWAVFHDLPISGSRANIDHLVIGPTGVWVVDTKTTVATVRASWRSVYFGDRRLDADPLLWESSIVSDRLGVAVRPILAIHGDGLRRRGGRVGRVPVVPASGLRRRLTRGRRRLTRAEVTDLAGMASSSFLVNDGPARV